MKERPILFSAPMVRATLEGRKTVTRRVVKPTGAVDVVPFIGRDNQPTGEFGWCPHPCYIEKHIRCPYGQPGDRLWVRETHSLHHTHGQHRGDDRRWGPWAGLPTTISADGTQIAYYREGFDRCDGGPWRPSIHMPRWASRITLEVIGVRVERLQDLSEAEAVSEGIERSHGLWWIAANDGPSFGSAGPAFRYLWEKINGVGSWDANPWVWCVSFRRIQP